jgi:hypothetical protein
MVNPQYQDAPAEEMGEALSQRSFVQKKFDEDELLRSEYGNRFYKHIQANNNAIEALTARWDVAEALYNLDHNETGLNLVEGLKSYPIPLWKPKADRIIGTVYQGITGIDPYVQILTDDGENDRADNIEKSLQLMAGRGNTTHTFDRAFLQCLTIAINTNISFLYAYKTAEAKVRFKAIHPKDFVMYPHEQVYIEDMLTVGHRTYKLRSQIEEKQIAGEYYDKGLSASQGRVNENIGKAADFSLIQDTEAVDHGDDQVTCYQLLHKCDIGEGLKWYRFLLAYQEQYILEVEEYPYSRPFYFDVRFVDEYSSAWPASSPGYSMQAIQKAYTDLHNVIIHGNYATSNPILCFIGGAMPAKFKRSQVGGIYELPAGTEVQVINTQFKGDQLAAMIPQLEKVADSVTRISQLGTSQNLPSSTTATAAAGMLKAQEEGKDQYTAFVAPSVVDVWRFLYELLEAHFDEFKEAYGASLPLESKADLPTTPLRFEATGKSAETNPRALLEKLQLLLNMSSSPESRLDYQKVEGQVVQSLNVPQDLKSLEKDAVAASEQIVQDLISQGIPPESIFQTLSAIIEQTYASLNGPPPIDGQEQSAPASPNPMVQGDGNPGYEGSGIAGPG